MLVAVLSADLARRGSASQRLGYRLNGAVLSQAEHAAVVVGGGSHIPSLADLDAQLAALHEPQRMDPDVNPDGMAAAEAAKAKAAAEAAAQAAQAQAAQAQAPVLVLPPIGQPQPQASQQQPQQQLSVELLSGILSRLQQPPPK